MLVIQNKTLKIYLCVCVYLVLEKQHYISWAHIQSFLQVRGQLLLPNDVTCCRRGLTGQRDPGGAVEQVFRLFTEVKATL